MTLPKVTFGIVNCNRLFYLKSCLESLLYCTKDYANKDIIIVDNASIEDGTEEYLEEQEKQGITVIRRKKRDPPNEFATGLNSIVRESTGDYICPLQGDMQFIIEGNWLKKYIQFYEKNIDTIGCIVFDAQRTVTNLSHKYSKLLGDEDFKFVYDYKRNPIAGAADVMYSRQIIDMIYPWCENNIRHEGGSDSETEMLKRVRKILKDRNISLYCAMPIFPISIAIYTDSRGTNARVRGYKRYGDYWPPKEGFKYYKIMKYEEIIDRISGRNIPIGIEEVALPIGWTAPIDARGNWKKNPIRPETATSRVSITDLMMERA